MTKAHRFRIPIRTGQWLSVTVWETHAGYVAGTAHYCGPNEHPYRIACYATLGRRKKTKGEFGRLFFSAENMGLGTVAHELQHFMFDWIGARYKVLRDSDDEALAYLCDRVTSTFWRKYYRAFGEQEIACS